MLLAVLAAGALYLFLTSDYLRAQIENCAGTMAGRKTTIARVEFDWGWTTRVRLDGVEISNAVWGKAPHMLTAKLVDFDIRLWPLLGGHIVLPRLTLEAPELVLERNEKGELNWSFEQSPAAATVAKQIAPEQRSDAPIIGQLKIEDGHVVYHDSKRRLELDGTVTTAIGKAPGSDQAELKLKGRLEDKPLTLHFIGGSILALRDDKTPYPLKLDVVFGPTKLSLEGTVQDPFQFKGADVDFSLSGPDLADVFPLLGVPGPPTPPYRMLGKLHREQGIWRLDDMKWHVGESDLFGTVTLDQRPKRSLLKANLVSEHLNFADLAPLIGATPGKRGNVSAQQKQTELKLEASGDLFPNIPLHVERLRVMDMDVTLDAHKVVSAPYLSVQALKARVKIDDGKAVVDPLKATLAGGVAAGSMILDARSDVPKAGANLRFDGLDLAAFFKGSRYFETTQGKLQGHINLIGTGRSLAQVMGTANGEFSSAMTGARSAACWSPSPGPISSKPCSSISPATTGSRSAAPRLGRRSSREWCDLTGPWWIRADRSCISTAPSISGVAGGQDRHHRRCQGLQPAEPPRSGSLLRKDPRAAFLHRSADPDPDPRFRRGEGCGLQLAHRCLAGRVDHHGDGAMEP